MVYKKQQEVITSLTRDNCNASGRRPGSRLGVLTANVAKPAVCILEVNIEL